MKDLNPTSLARKNIIRRKKRYILMTVGIVLAMIFSSGTIFFSSSLITSLNEIRRLSFGSQDVIISCLNRDAVDAVSELEIISDCGVCEKLGYAYSSEKGEQYGTAVEKLDENAMRMSYKRLLCGEFPEKAGEIAIEKDSLLRLGLSDAAPGDKITLTLNVCNENGYLEEPVEKTYILSGILRDQRNKLSQLGYYTVNSFPSAVVSDEEQIEPGGKCTFVIYIGYDKSSKEEDKFGVIADVLEETGYYDERNDESEIIFSEYIRPNGYSELYSNAFLAVTLTAVLMTVSCIGIVNAFNSNLRERKKYIGMLRALGATKKQIINIFGREAFIISLISVPVSIAVSYFGVKAIIGLMGDDFVFRPKLWVLLVCAAVSMICVMAASLVPLARISKTSPMLAIRSTDLNRKMKKKNIKTQKSYDLPRLLAKREVTFGRARLAAVSILLMAAIVLSTLGFSWVNAEYSPYEKKSDYEVYRKTYSQECQYINNVSDTADITDRMLNTITASPYVASVEASENRTVNWIISDPTEMQSLYILNEESFENLPGNTDVEALIDKDNYVSQLMSDSFTKRDSGLEVREQYNAKFGHDDKEILSCDFLIKPDRIIDLLASKVTDGKLDRKKLDSGEEVILLIPRSVTAYLNIYKMNDFTDIYINLLSDKENFTFKDRRLTTVELGTAQLDIKAGDEIDLALVYDGIIGGEGYFYGHFFDTAEEHTKTVKIGAIISDKCDEYEIYDYSGPIFITTKAGLEAFGVSPHPTNANIFLKEDATDDTDDAVCAMLDECFAGSNMSYFSSYALNKEREGEKKIMYIALISVIIMFFAICVALINNALTARIRENKRQIGTLRAAGASVNELTVSYIRQLVTMFAYGTAGGFAIYNAVYFAVLIYEKKHASEMIMDYFILPCVLMCAVTFAVCAVNLRIKLKEEMKNSIIDNIREL